jgi:hypothetical protein
MVHAMWQANSNKIGEITRMQSQQIPVGSGFGPETTAAQVIGDTDLRCKIAMATGGYGGLGLRRRGLWQRPAPPSSCRHDGLGRRGKLCRELRRSDGHRLERGLCLQIEPDGRTLHILVNNAGIMASPLMRDGCRKALKPSSCLRKTYLMSNSVRQDLP